ncbi:DUF3180 family protein [Nakamurella sp. YIM 132087]|uniref:DUF3180 family protein n=1 Tax=Nakamurella alba TaxID=2665158 RepID=A0A7K1FP08_9ACTN|nr:DUF3180 family protein [Nakamurella alba]
MGFTRTRDLLAVGLVAAIAGFLLVSLAYSSIPPLPRLAGAAPALLGVAEAIAGAGLRSRIRARREGGVAERPPVPPLTAARAMMTAKATSLAGAALAGLWIGLLLYVVPKASTVDAAADDTATGAIGLVGSLVMIGGALFLEHCCRTPPEERPRPDRDR